LLRDARRLKQPGGSPATGTGSLMPGIEAECPRASARQLEGARQAATGTVTGSLRAMPVPPGPGRMARPARRFDSAAGAASLRPGARRAGTGRWSRGPSESQSDPGDSGTYSVPKPVPRHDLACRHGAAATGPYPDWHAHWHSDASLEPGLTLRHAGGAHLQDAGDYPVAIGLSGGDPRGDHVPAANARRVAPKVWALLLFCLKGSSCILCWRPVAAS
jgi:hypothetical protein